jgi:4-hydroxybenzoate polyprenyltransferase
MIANMFWAIAYDTEYAMVDREDDRRLGLKSSAILLGRYDVTGVIVCHAIFLVMMVVIGGWQLLGLFYYVGIIVAALCVRYQFGLIVTRERKACFKAFLNNNWVGCAIFAGLAADLYFRIRLW